MKVKAASAARAIRWPGWGNSQGLTGRERVGRGGARTDRVEVDIVLRGVGQPREDGVQAGRFSPAWTRPRWRSGRARGRVSGGWRRGRGASWRLPPSGGVCRCRTRFSTTPPICTAGVEGGEAVSDGGGGLRLARDVQHEEHGQAEAGGEVCGAAAAAWGAGYAVEQAHGAFDPAGCRRRCRRGRTARPAAWEAWPSCRGWCRARRMRRHGRRGSI